MAMRKISKLLQEGQDALEKGNRAVARGMALQAIEAIDDEKDKLLSGQRSDINEQQIGDWYGSCSFILNSVGDIMSATKCFYTATVFDRSWDLRDHMATAEVLWGCLVFSKDFGLLAFEYQIIQKLLAEVDEIARLAERLGKWNVCMAADGDINTVYSYLMQTNLTADELINQPGRKASMWRTARCFLRLGMHDDARKLCSTILQHACDYDDPEAFEIWAFSLYSTKDFDIALEKCELALKYCKDEEYRRRLETFRSEIQNQKGNSDFTQQNDDENSSDDAENQLFENKNRNTNRHGQGAQKDDNNVLSTSSSSKQEMKDTLRPFARKLESANEQIIYERKHTFSRRSTSTVKSDRSEISLGKMFDSGEPGSSSDASFDIDLFTGEETLDGNVQLQIIQKEETLQEEMTFYEQSIRYHLQNDGSEYLEKVDSDEKLQKNDAVTTECQNPLKIQPNTKFSMTISREHQLKIQMSAALNRGVITPKPVLYRMTNNVNFCLQHTENPVLHLYHYVTRSTCDKYPDTENYLEIWLPIVLMEAATRVVRNEESYCINNVNIRFIDDRKGTFSLGLAECEKRNIELSGTISEDGDDVLSDETCASYDWLCLKVEIPNPCKLTARDKTKDFQNLNAVWIGHAQVIKVVKKKNQYSPDGKINVTFQLHDKTPALPSNFSSGTRFSIEILKKSEVDRRTESCMKELHSQSDSLAAKIALNKQIPDLDRSRSHIASLRHNQDLVFVKHQDDPTQRKFVLPRNNAKQQEAINKALTSRFSLIQGPPGTGIKYTAIKLMYVFDRINFQLSKEGHPRKQVLFSGPSNKSVDLVARLMLQRMGDYKPNFIRVYGRSVEEIDFPIPGRRFLSEQSTRGLHTDHTLKSVSLHHLIRQKGKKYAEEINAKDMFFRENNYEPMPEIVREYVHIAKEASIEEIRKYDIILCTTADWANFKVFEATNVCQVIIDEAGMCPEPQCLVPIIATKAEQVVLIGDHKQLRPIIMCKEAAQLGLETSLFERYATTKSSRNVQFTRLEKQYKINPEICRFPSKLFYDSALKTMPGIWRDETLTIWPTDAKGTYPHVLVHIEGEERVSTEDKIEQSRSNEAEIDHVITVYQYLRREVPNESVQILSQYNAQCSEIKRKLKQNGIYENEEVVSTVVSSQDGEWNYVIFSTVRSLPEHKIEKNPTPDWCKQNLGFLTDRNQVNVALTRARKGLIIIGNKDLLACDYVWKRLIQHYEQRGCLKKPEEFPPLSIRKSRQQIMRESFTRTFRRF